MPYRVILAEDSTLMREGLVGLLQRFGHTVVAAVGSADEIARAVDDHEPDLLITDVRMPPGHADDGVRAAVVLRAHSWLSGTGSQSVRRAVLRVTAVGRRKRRRSGLPAQGPHRCSHGVQRRGGTNRIGRDHRRSRSGPSTTSPTDAPARPPQQTGKRGPRPHGRGQIELRNRKVLGTQRPRCEQAHQKRLSETRPSQRHRRAPARTRRPHLPSRLTNSRSAAANFSGWSSRWRSPIPLLSRASSSAARSKSTEPVHNREVEDRERSTAEPISRAAIG